MKRVLLQGMVVFAALVAAGCSSSKAPPVTAPQQAVVSAVQPPETPVPTSVPLPDTKASPTSSIRPPITGLSNGMLVIGTIPGRAKVYLNNEFYGVTPLNVELKAGEHALSVKLEGYRMVAEEVTVRSGEYMEMDLTLER